MSNASPSNPTPSRAPSPALSVADARARLAASVTPVSGWQSVPVREALNRVLYADVPAPFDVPGYDNSAMDGFALRAADLAASGETPLKVIGKSFAGHPFAGAVAAGQAVRIMTGAMLPAGADTVVEQEAVQTDGDLVLIPPGRRLGDNVRHAGEELTRGKPALPAGRRIGPADVGLLAALGCGEVKVCRRLRVAFFSSGDELAALGTPLQPGQVYDSNRYTLYALLTRLGAEILDMGVVRDDPAAVEAALLAAAEQADVIITTGGVSVGDADYIKELAARLGSVDFWKIAIKPGKPMAFGRIGSSWLFGLPGNPVAATVTWLEVVQDALLSLMGATPSERPVFRVAAAFTIKKKPGRREFPRGVLFEEDGEWKVRLAGRQGSGMLTSIAEANCLVVLAEDQGNVSEGEPVGIQPLEGLY